MDMEKKGIFENDFCSTLPPHRNLQQKEMIYVGWDKPPEGWIKLNSDGACKGGGENSGCGGLFRSSDGIWLKGYIRKVGVCDALHAELWGMYLGLDMAWREHITQLIVESDSKTLIDMVTGSCMFSGAIPTLERRIHNLLTLDWHVQFHYTWREGKRCADWLTTFILSLDSFVVTRLEYPPSELHSFFFDDISRTCFPRHVQLVIEFSAGPLAFVQK
ncbi:putative ribonuclease H-like domain-containing protein [Medicago truncatula]|uniref:Putative ribonuclease H-like domain-containing protein n=1 Tax=Medicago truncatula TaxID=3880 RepID=A0A396HAM3_MEDTR|nr:putative ribonuclease H-like domain-containing protein [Medicago truncatula]